MAVTTSLKIASRSYLFISQRWKFPLPLSRCFGFRNTPFSMSLRQYFIHLVFFSLEITLKFSMLVMPFFLPLHHIYLPVGFPVTVHSLHYDSLISPFCRLFYLGNRQEGGTFQRILHSPTQGESYFFYTEKNLYGITIVISYRFPFVSTKIRLPQRFCPHDSRYLRTFQGLYSNILQLGRTHSKMR